MTGRGLDPPDCALQIQPLCIRPNFNEMLLAGGCKTGPSRNEEMCRRYCVETVTIQVRPDRRTTRTGLYVLDLSRVSHAQAFRVV